MLYLAYTPIDTISSTEQYELATDMSLAALTGEGIYNFGEVLSTPILSILNGTENQFLFELIKTINVGDIDNYNTLVNTHSNQYFSQQVLQNYHEKIQQKVILMCLLEMIFHRSSHDRIITFADISSKTRVPIEQVPLPLSVFLLVLIFF